MVDTARRGAASLGLPVRFERGDAIRLPLADRSVHACGADTVLQHLADPARAVAEMVRGTRPGRRICLTEFDLGTLDE